MTARASKKVTKLVCHDFSRAKQKAALDALTEAQYKVTGKSKVNGCLVLLVDDGGNAELCTTGTLQDPAQAVYHILRALNFDFIKRPLAR